jgi:hypothetical protein
MRSGGQGGMIGPAEIGPMELIGANPMTKTIYLVRRFRGDRLAHEFGQTEAATPQQALDHLAHGYREWTYQDHGDGSGRLVNPEDAEEYVAADPVFLGG